MKGMTRAQIEKKHGINHKIIKEWELPKSEENPAGKNWAKLKKEKEEKVQIGIADKMANSEIAAISTNEFINDGIEKFYKAEEAGLVKNPTWKTQIEFLKLREYIKGNAVDASTKVEKLTQKMLKEKEPEK